MSKLTDRQDAYGHAMYDAYLGKEGYQVHEADDGCLQVGSIRGHLTEYEDWLPEEKQSMRLVKGKARLHCHLLRQRACGLAKLIGRRIGPGHVVRRELTPEVGTRRESPGEAGAATEHGTIRRQNADLGKTTDTACGDRAPSPTEENRDRRFG